MSDGFSEGILYGGNLTGDITLPADQGYLITAGSVQPSLVFYGTDKAEPVLTITPEGELIFRDVTEAAIALKTEWDRLRGAW